jgi:HEAT repeat protein
MDSQNGSMTNVDFPQFRAKHLKRLIKDKDVLGLIEALQYTKVQQSHGHRILIVNSLGRLGDSRAVQPISAVLKSDPDAPTRGAAAVALGRLRDPAGLPALQSALNDEARSNRQWAMRSIGYLRDRDSVDRLIEFLKSEHVGTRACAAQALGDIGDQRATPSLIELLEDPKSRVKRAAAAGLAKLGDSRGLEPVRRAHEQAGFLARKGIEPSLRDLESRFS